MFRKKWFWIVVVLWSSSAAAPRRRSRGAARRARRSRSKAIQKRDLEAIVSASGKIDPKKTVNISAQTMGRVTRLAVKEGDRVKRRPVPAADRSGQRRSRGAPRRRRRSPARRTALEQSRVGLQSARANLEVARQTLKRQQELWAAGLTTREILERAQAEVEVRESDLRAREQEIKNRETQLNQQEAGLRSSQHTLAQVRFEAPFDGIVTRRNIEEGENVMVGTMNNAGTVLLTVADMSVIEAEVEVDETDIPFVQLGQLAKVMIDAIADKKFTGTVTEIGNSPIQAAGARHDAHRDELQGHGDDRRPDSGGASGIHLHGRDHHGDPKQAVVGADPVDDRARAALRRAGQRRARAAAAAPGLPVRPAAGRRRRRRRRRNCKPGEKREEVEGVFLMRDGKAAFAIVKTGIAGERYLEVLDRAEGRRPGHHRPVRFGARHV